MIILGDFNLLSLNWGSETAVRGYVSPHELLFFYGSSVMGFWQWAHEGTFIHSNDILDVLLTTESHKVGDVCVLGPFPRCHCLSSFHNVLQFVQEDSGDSTVSHLECSK